MGSCDKPLLSLILANLSFLNNFSHFEKRHKCLHFSHGMIMTLVEAAESIMLVLRCQSKALPRSQYFYLPISGLARMPLEPVFLMSNASLLSNQVTK